MGSRETLTSNATDEYPNQAIKIYAKAVQTDSFPKKEQPIVIDALDGISFKEYKMDPRVVDGFQDPLIIAKEILAEVLDCPDYIVNPCTFWYLDTIAAALNKAQKDTSMTLAEQKQMIAWFGHIMNIFREKRWSREEILCNVNADIMVIGYNLDNFSWVAPAPQPARSYLMTATTSRSFTQVEVPKGWIYLPYIF
ncbi:Protein of unknown function, partial [Gryllus bimaculatus]